jgi:hypothetical protein
MYLGLAGESVHFSTKQENLLIISAERKKTTKNISKGK